MAPVDPANVDAIPLRRERVREILGRDIGAEQEPRRIDLEGQERSGLLLQEMRAIRPVTTLTMSTSIVATPVCTTVAKPEPSRGSRRSDNVRLDDTLRSPAQRQPAGGSHALVDHQVVGHRAQIGSERLLGQRGPPAVLRHGHTCRALERGG